MNIKEAVNLVASKFIYKADKLKIYDSWRVMKLQDKHYYGDCDDFSITCFWYYSDKNLKKFIWNILITHKYKLYRVKTVSGGYHVVGSVDDLWFDNWSKEALSKADFFERTKHKITMRYISPIIGTFLLIGLFLK